MDIGYRIATAACWPVCGCGYSRWLGHGWNDERRASVHIYGRRLWCTMRGAAANGNIKGRRFVCIIGKDG
jgi:hypothetical protein